MQSRPFFTLQAIAGTCVMLFSASAEAQRAKPAPGSTLRLTATAYCQDGKTQSGTHTRAGIVAADPKVLPVGSVLRLETPARYAGIYTVMDTGAAIKGAALDIFIDDCRQAMRFGRQSVRVRIVRRGWDPKATADLTAGR